MRKVHNEMVHGAFYLTATERREEAGSRRELSGKKLNKA